MKDNLNPSNTRDPFFGCPQCGKTSKCLNIGRDHWCYCTDDRVTWMIGSNLFSSWRDETEADWAANRQFLDRFCPVQCDGTPDRAAISNTVHIADFDGGFHILQVPGPDGTPFKAWPGPFESELAASLFRDDLLCAYFEGNPNDACCSSGILDFFNVAARFLACIGQDTADNRRLATKLASKRPWENRQKTMPSAFGDNVPF